MSLYHHHLQTLVERYNHACDALKLDTIALHTGSLTYYANDDISHPFRPMPLAQQWLPFDAMPEAWIIFSKDTGLTLVWPDQPDFWHISPTLQNGDWQRDWRILKGSETDIALLISKHSAVLSHQPETIKYTTQENINPQAVVHWLNYDRAVKTEWEIEQMRLANQRAARGHQAAQQAFLAGQSEYDIHLQYLQASGQQQIEEPYSSIVALNQSAAVLHYEAKNPVPPTSVNTLLIDAGVKVNGYASDITRTFSEGNAFFHNLIKEMDVLQQQLNDMCLAGNAYVDIHQHALEKIARLLNHSGLCKLSVEEQLEKRVTQAFFPHGIGHLLGLNVHDAGGLQLDRDGQLAERPDHAPFLRLMRPLEENMVVTIEPGLYFIPMLLDKMQQEIKDHGCDLELIEMLKPFGGIRIEDNVVVKTEGPLNLTRVSFEEIDFCDFTV